MTLLTDRPRLTFLVSDSESPCGVEAFARLMAETAGERAGTRVLDGDPFAVARAVAGSDALVINLPVVAWKKRLVEPVAAALAARARGVKVVLVLHEWADLDPKRRVSYLPLLPLANAILFSAPEVRAQFEARAASKLATARRGLVPIPPNLAPPAETRATAASDAIDRARGEGKLIIGQFGSIYPKKQSTVVLDVAARLLAEGSDPFVVFAGSFIKGQDRVEETFLARVRELGLEERVLVTGYIPGEPELFHILGRVDAFVYVFAEGLTSRRGSVLAAVAAGRPVVVNAPREQGAFDHHPTYGRAIEAGLITLLPFDATPDNVARAVRDVAGRETVFGALDTGAAARDALAAVDRMAG